MYRRIETRTIDTAGGALTTIIQKNPCKVHWISVSAQALATQGLIQMYDGFDTGGKLKWQLEPGYSRQNCFCPVIPCEQGLTIYNDANIASYTVAYSCQNWPKEPA